MKTKLSFEELDKYIGERIQGVFGKNEMAVMKEEIEKLDVGDVYLEIGVNEGKSFAVAHHYAKEGVYIIGIDIEDVVPFEYSIGRAPFMQSEGMVGLDKTGFYVHGDANLFAKLFKEPFINLLFIDGFHGYEDVKRNVLNYEPLVKQGGVILYHDYDHPGVRQWTDECYGSNKEVIGRKIVKVIKNG